MENIKFRDIKPGDTFRVSRKFEDEWFLRGDWMRTDTKNDCVCLTQGVHNQGTLYKWRDEVPVELIKKRVLP